MAKPFDHFLPESKNILVQAQKIAEEQKQPINSSHILAAIVLAQNSVAYDILVSHGLDRDKMQLSLSIVKRSPDKKLKITIEAKKIIKDSLAQAKKFKHQVVAPEHLLLAIITNPKSLAFQLILDLDLDPEEIKRELQGLFNKADLINQTPNLPGMSDMPEDIEEMDQVGTSLMAQQQFKQRKEKILTTFATNLVTEAKKDKLDPLIGRETELDRSIKILNRRTKNNPVLVGEAGVGKTAIVEGLAQKIAKGQVPHDLKTKQILSLDLGLLLAGTKYRGQFEERIKKIVKEIKEDSNIILFIDEIHTLAGAGAAEGSIDAANIIKPALAKGDLRLIGSTTLDEYQKYIEKDSALERRLQVVKVDQPTPSRTMAILKGLQEKYEDHHQVRILPEAIKAAVDLSVRYIPDRQLPDKAIDLIDEAASALSLNAVKTKDGLKVGQIQKEIEKSILSKEQAVIKQDYEKAANQRESEIKLKKELVAQKMQVDKKKHRSADVTTQDIAQVVSEWTGVPVTDLIKEERKRYQDLENQLKTKIIGQKPAIRKLAKAIRRSRTGISQAGRPIGSFVFLGPTGVGKTELAKVLAEVMFDRDDALVRIDMSEFIERHNASKLIGAPPGYVGYEEGGKLTDQVKRNPYSVVLLDEIEKAHPDIQNILLQILEDGQITDGQGRKVDFSNTIIIITSNLGTKALSKEAAVGFQAGEDQQSQAKARWQKTKQQILLKLKDRFRPEFINRLDEIIVFKPLTPASIKQIVKVQLKELKDRLKKQKALKLEITTGAINYLAKKGFDPDLGARPVRRAITKEIEDQISEKILATDKQVDTIKIKKDTKNKLVIN